MNALLMAVWRRNPQKQMFLAKRCHRKNMKISIINGSELSRLSVAIIFLIFWQHAKGTLLIQIAFMMSNPFFSQKHRHPY